MVNVVPLTNALACNISNTMKFIIPSLVVYSFVAITGAQTSPAAHNVNLIYPVEANAKQPILWGLNAPGWEDGSVRNFSMSLHAPNGTLVGSLPDSEYHPDGPPEKGCLMLNRTWSASSQARELGE